MIEEFIRDIFGGGRIAIFVHSPDLTVPTIKYLKENVPHSEFKSEPRMMGGDWEIVHIKPCDGAEDQWWRFRGISIINASTTNEDLLGVISMVSDGVSRYMFDGKELSKLV